MADYIAFVKDFTTSNAYELLTLCLAPACIVLSLF